MNKLTKEEFKSFKDNTLNHDYNTWTKNYKMASSVIIETNKKDIIGIATQGQPFIDQPQTISEHHIFRIASISKTIVAIRIMQLVEAGKLFLDEDISHYLGYDVRNPLYPQDAITLRMLLTQTSSLEDVGEHGKGYEGVNEHEDYVALKDVLCPDGACYAEGTWSRYKPGTHWSYANFGCGILACIIECVTHVSFFSQIKDELLKPMGIETGFKASELPNSSLVAGHYTYDEEQDSFHLYRDYQKFVAHQNPYYPLGNNFRGIAGGLFISPYDLSKIMRMLMNYGTFEGKRYLQKETVKLMETIQWEGVSDDPTYRAKGLQMIILDQFTKEPLKGHFGNAYGLRSFMLYTHTEGFIFISGGANFLNDVNHMTILQENLIKFLVERTPVKL